jgi:hypothetical protein
MEGEMSDKQKEQDNLDGFLDALTNISRRYGIGITGRPELYDMERDDYERQYRYKDGELTHGDCGKGAKDERWSE